MEKILYILACIANLLMICGVFVIISNARSSEIPIALLMVFPPLLSILALRKGPDIEERRLGRQLSKAKMRDELKKLGVDPQ